MKERIPYLDTLKGFLIICVILGHCIQFGTTDFDNNPVFRFIYSFHMPLFMWVSGYVSFKFLPKIGTIKKRFTQLIIPFFAWALLGCFLSSDWNKMLLILKNPTLSNWFIWDLFIISSIVTVSCIISKRLHLSNCLFVIGICVCIDVILHILDCKILDLTHSLEMGTYYVLGYFMSKYKDRVYTILVRRGGIK